MTAVAAPAPPASRPRPVPWTKLAWITWRQHRVALAGVAVLLGGLGSYLLIMGLKIQSGYASVASCHPASSAACGLASDLFLRDYYPTAQTVTGFLQVIPVLVGVFVGGPVLARELETGTFRFAWTQGCGRLRWVIAKLALLAIAVTAAAEAFSLLFSWYFHLWFAEGLDGALAPQLFDLRGVDFAAWTLLAFALGVAAGALIRRTVPAMAAAMAAWTGLFFATFMFLRKHYQPPLVASGATANTRSFASNWTWAQWYTGPNGKPVSQQTIRNVVDHAPASVRNSANPNAATAYLSAHHYTQWWAYQPQSRYWHFQLIEGGWLLALSLILLAATVWLVRRRAA
jgi:ABC-2 family transporter protein